MRGFSLIEVLVTTGILSIIGASTVWLGLDTLGRFHSREDSELVWDALIRARTKALNGVCIHASCTEAAAHGVWVSEGAIVLFEGSSFSSRKLQSDERTERSNAPNGVTQSEVVFNPHVGTVASTVAILVVGTQEQTRRIIVHANGALDME